MRAKYYANLKFIPSPCYEPGLLHAVLSKELNETVHDTDAQESQYDWMRYLSTHECEAEWSACSVRGSGL